ncbi:MAG: hypothetical protein A3D67_01780 [Candidatus Lloydbacteria bacterium RIFCSPHIGHO2_02_FULL_51_22]|uniref:Uncharacterized protein n=2 Tax=Candidatus Lloydiibacteriota TaxID=1817910 RepID=A0A1G2DI65_9BACT|nr:MAG: hypothetical protein A3D67_01780 [Candidatus Lloydbacteria bacterium RIFCSPHIGHO2_02_FULL_51_22]OGZ16068.1 MAG: hypothetical protein A3G11_02725 [Candidatus Lloydbacteria bacterium RIFCSPLOWO2_12_FULL_51_9]
MFTEIFKQSAGTTRHEETRFDRYAAYIIITSACLMPLFFIPFSVFSLPFAKALLLALTVLIALLLWFIGRLQDGVLHVPKSMVLAALLAILGTFLVSTFLSPSFVESFGGVSFELGTFVSIALLVLISFLGAMLFESRVRLFSLYIALTVSFILVCVFQVAQAVLGDSFFLWRGFDANAASFLGTWNDLALFAGMTALLALITIEYLTLGRKALFFFYGVLCLALLALIVTSFSLAWGILGVFALIVVVYRFSLVLFAKKNGRALAVRTFPYAALLVLLLSVLFFLAGDALQGAISSTLNINKLEVRPSWNATTEIVKGTWQEHLIFGAGPNLFVSQWLLFKNEAVNTSLFWNTDFQYGIGLLPTFAVTTGLLGLLALLFFLGTLFYRGARAFFAAGDEATHYFVFSLFGLLVYLWSATIFYVPGYPLVMFAFLLTGCFIALLAQKKFIGTLSFSYTNDPRVGFATVLLLVACLIGTVVSGYFVVKRVVAFYYYADARAAFEERGDIARADYALGKAVQFHTADLFYRSLVDVRLAQIQRLFSEEGLDQEVLRTRFQELFGSAVALGNAAIEEDATDYVNWFTRARTYSALVPLEIPGAYESAKEALRGARERNPQSPQLVLDEARLEIAHGAKEEGRKRIQEALALKNNYSDAIFVLAQLDIDAGNAKGAIQSLEQAAYLNPNDSGVFFRIGLLKYDIKDYAGARDALRRAVEIIPEYANARYYLGLTNFALGDIPAAIAEFEAIAKTNPGNTEIGHIIERLKGGQSPFPDAGGSSLDLDEPPLKE